LPFQIVFVIDVLLALDAACRQEAKKQKAKNHESQQSQEAKKPRQQMLKMPGSKKPQKPRNQSHKSHKSQTRKEKQEQRNKKMFLLYNEQDFVQQPKEGATEKLSDIAASRGTWRSPEFQILRHD